MQLTRHTDYAFRSLIFMASMPAGSATIGEISEAFNMPKNHLMKVISSLVSNGYVNSVRGKKGGVSLAKPASDINLKEIVLLMEKTLAPFDCVGQECIILNSCRLKKAFSGAQEKYLDYLGEFTIADMQEEETTHIIHGPLSI